MKNVASLRESIFTQISIANDESALESARIAIFGKKGVLSLALSSLGSLPLEERKTLGRDVNALRDDALEALGARKVALRRVAIEAQMKTEALDLTLPERAPSLLAGRAHPVSHVFEEVMVIFGSLGFTVAEGPDVETDEYNFTKLNFPPHHPAREMHDTFFLSSASGERKLLRTHTSPVQIRTLEKQDPPVRIICPGRTYRRDLDQTHLPMFHQVEGLVVDKSATIAELKWLLLEFCRLFFENSDVKIRFRPSFFPFTEPSMEVDVQCDRSGKSIVFGKGDDWMEILGCGMVHPNVLSGCGHDPDVFQGYAWGVGVERLAMLKYGMDDLRPFVESDLRWSKRYGFSPLDVPGLLGGLSLSPSAE